MNTVNSENKFDFARKFNRPYILDGQWALSFKVNILISNSKESG